MYAGLIRSNRRNEFGPSHQRRRRTREVVCFSNAPRDSLVQVIPLASTNQRRTGSSRVNARLHLLDRPLDVSVLLRSEGTMFQSDRLLHLLRVVNHATTPDV